MRAAWCRLVTRSTRDDRRLVRILILTLAYLGGWGVLQMLQ